MQIAQIRQSMTTYKALIKRQTAQIKQLEAEEAARRAREEAERKAREEANRKRMRAINPPGLPIHPSRPGLPVRR